MKTFLLLALCFCASSEIAKSDPGLALHLAKQIGVDVDLPDSPVGGTWRSRQLYWLGGQAPRRNPPYFLQRGDHEVFSIEATAILSKVSGVSYEMGYLISVVNGSGSETAHAEKHLPIITNLCCFVKIPLVGEGVNRIAKLTPKTGYARYIAIVDGVVLGEALLPAGSKSDFLRLKVPNPSATWAATHEQLLGLLRKVGLEGAVEDPTLPETLLSGGKRFYTLKEAFSDAGVASPLEVILQSHPLEVFEHEPVVFDAVVKNRGIPSHGFYYGCQVAMKPEDYGNQFRLVSAARETRNWSREALAQSPRLKYLESATLQFNARRDFGLETEGPGPMAIAVSGRFFQTLDNQGIEEAMSFNVVVKALPSDRIQETAGWESPAAPGVLLSIGKLEENGETLFLMIERKEGNVTRVLRLGTHGTDSKWTLALDPAVKLGHILLEESGTQTYWQTEPQLTGLREPEVFKDGKPRSLKTGADGKVELVTKR